MSKIKESSPATSPRRLPTTDEWERSWQKHWSKVGLPGYELPVGGPGGDEREFLAAARTPQKEHARLQRISAEFDRAFKTFSDVGPAVTVFGSARFKETHPYYKLARAVGAELARAGFATLTGGGPGIMEAANRGAYEVGAKSIGLNITLPHEQEPNPYITPELCFQFHYFALRKFHFLLRAKGLVAFPGGFGTMDELFEALTLLQTGKIKPLPVVLVGRQYWEGVVNFQTFVDEGTIRPEDLGLFQFAETAEEVWGIICRFHHMDPVRPRF